MFKKIDRNHVSDIDRFLQELDKQQTEKTASQKAEIDKHARIHGLRDGIGSTDEQQSPAGTNANTNSDKPIWDEF